MSKEITKHIVYYLQYHRRLVIPQLGAFIVKEWGKEVLFSELFKRDDGALRKYLVENGFNEIEAAGAIDHLVFDIRHDTQEGTPFAIPGLGTLYRNEQGALLFDYRPATTTTGQAVGQTAQPDETAPTSTAQNGKAEPSEPEEKVDETTPHLHTEYADPAVKGLTYGRPIKSTNPYLNRNKPARQIDKFMIVAIVAAVLAVAAIVYGYFCENRADEYEYEMEEEYVPISDTLSNSALEQTEDGATVR
jgi:hypothetical protein